MTDRIEFVGELRGWRYATMALAVIGGGSLEGEATIPAREWMHEPHRYGDEYRVTVEWLGNAVDRRMAERGEDE